jgi:ankyrin repeat protein
VDAIVLKTRSYLLCVAAALTLQTAVAGPTATLSIVAARERLETFGLPPGADAFARAVATRHQPLIDLCFAARLEINAPDEAGRSPLLLAALQGNSTLARRLLDAGARVDAADQAGVTPLMAAAMHGDVQLLRTFLPCGVCAEAGDKLGRTALHYAIAARHLPAVELLLPLGPRLPAPCLDGKDALTLAYESKNPLMISTVLEAAPGGLEWTTGSRQALSDALLVPDRKLLRLLLSKHRDPPAPEGYTIPMLAYAIVMNQTRLFDILLDSGADPNMQLPASREKDFLNRLSSSFLREYAEFDSGITPLMIAAGLGKTDYVKALLEAGANRNLATRKHKMLPIYFAARSDDWRCTQLLLGNGPSPEELRIEISLASQEAVLVKNGARVFSTECSTGRDGFATPTGRYVVTDKQREHHSTIYKVPMPFFMRLSCRDFGMHEGVVPNYPASHGCIRLPSTAARKFFAEIPVGTLVTIN